jgi:hypothetical protein
MIIPSTSEVLRPYYDLSWVKEEHLQRGQIRHQNYAAHLLGTWAPALPQEDQGSLDSFKRWADKYIAEPFSIEARLIDEDHGYSGTIDFVGKLVDGISISPIVVLDWKPPSGKGPVVRAQVASYLNLAQKNGWKAKKAGILRMDPKGGPATMEWIEAGSMDFAGFLAALSAWRYFNQ